MEKVWNKVANKYNIYLRDKSIRDIMGLTKNEIINYYFADDIKFGEKFITECQNKENEYLSKYGGGVYKNTIKTIQILNENHNLYIVSNCQAGYIETFLNYYNLNRYFKDYESSGNTGKDKNINIKAVLERNNINLYRWDCIDWHRN